MELDRERVSEREFSIEVRASDRGSPPLEGVIQVVVRTIDINDSPPTFERDIYEGETRRL